MNFDTFSQISYQLIQGINLKSRVFKLYNDCSCLLLPKRTSLSETQRYEVFTREDYEEKFYELLELDSSVKHQNDLNIPLQREKYINQLIKLYSNDTYMRFQSQLKSQAKETVQKQQAEIGKNLAPAPPKTAPVQNPPSKFKSLDQKPQTQPKRLISASKSPQNSDSQILQKISDFCINFLKRLNTTPTAQPLLYISATKLADLQQQIINQEKQLLTLKTHVENSRRNFENLSEKLFSVRKISVQYNKFLESTTELKQDARNLLLEAGNRLKLADQAAEKIMKGVKIDISQLVEVRNSLVGSVSRREMTNLGKTEELVERSLELKNLLIQKRQGEDVEGVLLDKLTGFEMRLNQYIFDVLGVKDRNVENNTLDEMFE